MARKNANWSRTWLIAVEVIGLGIALFLFLISARLIMENVPCPRGKWFACNDAVRGPYSKIGPIPHVVEGFISISAMGLFYFAAQLVLTALLRRKGWDEPVRFAKTWMMICGLAFVGYLRAIEIMWMHKVCPWCLAVALLTVIETVLFFPMFIPELPRMGWAKRTGLVLAYLSIMIAAGIGITRIVPNPGKIEYRQTKGQKTGSEPAGTPGPKNAGERENGGHSQARAPRTPTPAPAATQKHGGGELPVPPSATKAPSRHSVTPAANQQQPEPGEGMVPDTAETKILEEHGWQLVATTQAVEWAIRSQPPVLLLVYDPECTECQGYVQNTLSQPQLDELGQTFTRIAIEQNALTGQLSNEVKNVPTTLVIDEAGKVRFKQEGRMSVKDLLDATARALQPAARP